jgi:hypothetical protein
MTETLSDKNNQISGSHNASVKKLYQKPVLTKMGALRDVTMQKSSGKTSDGRKSKYSNLTGRGGLHVVEG